MARLRSWIDRSSGPFGSSRFDPRRFDPLRHEHLRLRMLLVVTGLKLLHFFGGNWDVQWHVEIGRDSFFIPPHQMALLGFILAVVVTVVGIAYEDALARAGAPLRDVVRVAGLTAPVAYWGAMAGFCGVGASALLDELFHRLFGIDITLWSLPHLLIMGFMFVVDVSLMIGITTCAGRLGLPFNWRNSAFWGFVLAASFTYDSANFQLSQAFLVGYRAGGAGLMGLLFPVLMGVIFPLPLLLSLGMARRLWAGLPILAMTLLLQYIGTGISALGFAILKPESVIEDFVRVNPDTVIALAREFGRLNGFSGLIGIQQAYAIWFSALPIALVALLALSARARRHPLVAAPVYGISLVWTCYLGFQRIPVMATYDIAGLDLLAATAIVVAGGLVTGWFGLWVAGIAAPRADLTTVDPALGGEQVGPRPDAELV